MTEAYNLKKDFQRDEMPADTNTISIMMTPTVQIVALYAGYDRLLDALEAVQSQLQSTHCRDQRVHNTLRMRVHDICEALADVHEKIAEFVIISRVGGK
jgi:hypothetical protein